MRRALPLAALALAVAPAGAQAAERVVDMPAKYFVPPNLTTLAGDTVTWTNSDTIDHDVALIGGGFDSGIIGPGGRFSQTISQPGHYAYHCTIHAFMAGTIDVYSFQLLGPDHPISIGRPAIAARHRAGRDGRGADRVARAHRHGVGAGHRRRARRPTARSARRSGRPRPPSTARSRTPARACRCR